MTTAFDSIEGELRREEGLRNATTPALRRATLRACQTYLRLLALTREGMEVTADDAAWFLESTGLPANYLGNAAGSLFRGKHWAATGKTQASARKSNHAHRNMIWQYRPEREQD